jgi:hypothetical protein
MPQDHSGWRVRPRVRRPRTRVRLVKRPALAPMYTALGLTSLDQVISNRKLRWAGHVRRRNWSRVHRVPAQFLTGRGSTHLAAEDGHTLTGMTSRASSS